jgi:hypothetical protein
MSMIFFDNSRVEQLYSLLEFHFDKVKPIIRYNPYYAMFARDEEKSSGTLKLPFEEDQCETKFIQYIFHYAIISNWVAYSVQNQQAIDFKELEEIDFDFVAPKPGTLKALVDELLHLHYNMNTNSSNFFIDEKWHKPFRNIINGLIRQAFKI